MRTTGLAHMPDTPQVAFLGFAERAGPVQEGPFTKWNVIGLKSNILTFFFPMSLAGVKWALAFRNIGGGASPVEFKLLIKNACGENVGWLNMEMTREASAAPPVQIDQPVVSYAPEGWTVILASSDEDPIVISRPGSYLVSQVKPNNSEETVVVFNVFLANPPALTSERIAAIKSDPSAVKAARIEIACKNCPSKVRAWVGLDRTSSHEDFSWYEEIDDEFVCGCGTTKLDLRSIKRNLHGLLGHPLGLPSAEIRFTPLYERSALDELRINFGRLLDSDPPEEILQKFIQANPLLLHQFPAESLFFKPAILTFFNADFALVPPQKELIVVEIETTQTRLMTKSGNEAGPLRHAFDQVRNWLHVIDEHRLAVLDSLGIKRELVSSVRGVVIAGRDRGYDAEHLRRLKGVDRGRIMFLTFDDLAFGLAALVGKMSRL